MRRPNYEMLSKYFSVNERLSGILNSLIDRPIIFENPFPFKTFLDDNNLGDFYSELSAIGLIYQETYEITRCSLESFDLKFLDRFKELKNLTDFLKNKKCDKITFSNPKGSISIDESFILKSFIDFIKIYIEEEFKKYKKWGVNEGNLIEFQRVFKKTYPRKSSIKKEWLKEFNSFFNFLQIETPFNDSKYSNTDIYKFIIDFCCVIGIDPNYLPDARDLRKYI